MRIVRRQIQSTARFNLIAVLFDPVFIVVLRTVYPVIFPRTVVVDKINLIGMVGIIFCFRLSQRVFVDQYWL